MAMVVEPPARPAFLMEPEKVESVFLAPISSVVMPLRPLFA